MKGFVALVAGFALTALAFDPAKDFRKGLSLEICGLEQDLSDPAQLRCAQYAADRPLAFAVKVANETSVLKAGELTVSLNNDWRMETGGRTWLELGAHSTQTVSCVACATGCVHNALYPVHATFGDLHAVGVFEATKGRNAMVDVGRPSVFDSLAGVGRADNMRCFELNSSLCGAFVATVGVGERGLCDGFVSFESKECPECVYRLDGWTMRMLLPAGMPANGGFSRVEVRSEGTRLVVDHVLSIGANYEVCARATVEAVGGALRVSWLMPGVNRDRQGLPRFDRLRLGSGSAPPERVYCGFGNVLVKPGRFSLPCRSPEVGTRHVGADFTDGFSLCVATALSARTLDVLPDERVFSPVAAHDNAFYLIPSSRGVFRAAREWRELNGFRKSPGFDRLVGRMCFDEWGGPCRDTAKCVRQAAEYGMNASVLVKHDWQAHGFDYRLPDIYPPARDAVGFTQLAAACRDSGVIFCPHDNYIDFYPDASGFSYDKVAFDAKGAPLRAWFNRGRAAQSYRWLPAAYAERLADNCRNLLEAGGGSGLFIDVFGAMEGFDCYSRSGRFYRSWDTSQAWAQAFDDVRRHLNRADAVTISEGGDDHQIGHLDGAQSDHFAATHWKASYVDSERIPWHDMASHGRMVLFAGGLGHRYSETTWGKKTDPALHSWGSDDYLSGAVAGGRSPMCYGPFNRLTVMTYYLQQDALSELAKADFLDFEFAGGNIHRHHSIFSCGDAWVNRSTNDVWQVAGVVLPSYGYFIRTPTRESGIVEKDGQRCAYARTPNRLFVDARPYWHNRMWPRLGLYKGPRFAELGMNVAGNVLDFGGLKTNGALLMERLSPFEIRLRALPDSQPFTVAVDVKQAFASKVRVDAVFEMEPPAEKTYREGCLTFNYDPRVREYSLKAIAAVGSAGAGCP